MFKPTIFTLAGVLILGFGRCDDAIRVDLDPLSDEFINHINSIQYYWSVRLNNAQTVVLCRLRMIYNMLLFSRVTFISGRPQFSQGHSAFLYQRIDGRARDEQALSKTGATFVLHRRTDRSPGEFRR